MPKTTISVQESNLAAKRSNLAAERSNLAAQQSNLCQGTSVEDNTFAPLVSFLRILDCENSHHVEILFTTKIEIHGIQPVHWKKQTCYELGGNVMEEEGYGL